MLVVLIYTVFVLVSRPGWLSWQVCKSARGWLSYIFLYFREGWLKQNTVKVYGRGLQRRGRLTRANATNVYKPYSIIDTKLIRFPVQVLHIFSSPEYAKATCTCSTVIDKRF